ncbi:MAG: hypothetical protein Q8M94_03630, partial [Ignavibacteria bacterium]|nr:hypothetical protein [Ignavibacteria bacterium]
MKIKHMVLFALFIFSVNIVSAIYITEGVSNIQQTDKAATISSSSGSSSGSGGIGGWKGERETSDWMWFRSSVEVPERAAVLYRKREREKEEREKE